MVSPLALLFDLDGTLVDTDYLHFSAYQTLLQDFGKSITLDYYKTQIMGAPNDKIMRELFTDLPTARHAELSERKEALFRKGIASDLTPTPGLMALIDWAEANGIPMCVVTNAPRANAELMLKGLHLDKRLPQLVIGDELARGKPDPLPYLIGLQRLGTQADCALAFEDSGPGVTAASQAGIFTYGMRGALDDTALRAAGARDVLMDFKSENLWLHMNKMLSVFSAGR